jgi:hypothetical protein
MNIRPSRGISVSRKPEHLSTQARFASAFSCQRDARAHAKRWWASARPRSILLLPIDQRRRDEIAAAVAAYDSANPGARLPRSTVPLLSAMFPIEDVCQRSLQDIAAEGFDRKRLAANLRRLAEAGFLSRTPGSGRAPDTYRLHLPPVRR